MAATCPHCGAKLNLSSAQPGGTIKCSCGKAFRLKPRQATGASATPHSVKSDDPAVCEQCGAILARADARFCPTCGEALGLPGKPPGQAAARPSPTPDTARKPGIWAVLGWVFGVFLVLGGIGGLADGAVVAGVALMFMGLVLLPPVAKAAAKKSGRPFTVGHKAVLFVVGFIVAIVSMPKDAEPPAKQAAPEAPGSVSHAGESSSGSQERTPTPAAPAENARLAAEAKAKRESDARARDLRLAQQAQQEKADRRERERKREVRQATFKRLLGTVSGVPAWSLERGTIAYEANQASREQGLKPTVVNASVADKDNDDEVQGDKKKKGYLCITLLYSGIDEEIIER